MHSFRKLKVWQLAIEISKNIYLLTQKLPPQEVYGMSSQMKRASVSIAANIAEGSGRNSSADFARFLSMANGSAYELETHLIICQEVGLLSTDDVHLLYGQLEVLQKMIVKLIQKFSQNK